MARLMKLAARRSAWVETGFRIAVVAACLWIAPAMQGQPADETPPGASADAAWRVEAQWDEVDEISTADIHRYTTEPRFLTPLVSYIPESADVPSPRDVLGYIAGTEGKLTHPDDEYRYFEALAAASPRVELREMGRTEEGRRMLLVVVSSEANLAKLEDYKAASRALADPRVTDEARAIEIIAETKPIMHVTAGLHSPETGSPEMVMELAYRLAVSEHPDIRQIRDSVVLLITPVTEVDGRARMVEWYYRYLQDSDNRFVMPSRSPPYWGSHAYHDNNRDGLQMTLKLTQHYVAAFHEWHPVYSLDLHESVPYLYVSTGTGPYNETLDPITISEWQWIANWEITELNRQGLPGVWTWGYYTGWNPSYLLWVTNNHNSMGRFYETFGNASARTMERDVAGSFAGRPVTSRQWYRTNPPDKKVVWSLRNNNNYMQSGVLASLSLTARNGDKLLHNFWRKGRNSLARGRDEKPHAWVIPADQPAKDRLAYLISQLQRHAIEVHRATADFELEEGEFKEGDFVVRLDQPYGDFARNLLQIGKFPPDAEQRPYDDVSWTLGKIYRVETTKIDDATVLELDGLELLTDPPSFGGSEIGSGRRGWAIANDGSNSLITLRYRLRDFEVLSNDEAFEDDGTEFPPGSFIIPAQNGVGAALEPALTTAMLDVHRLRQLPEVATHAVDLPRLALYHNWVSTQPDGWVRYVFQQAGVDYEYINDDDVRAGDLGQRFDVIVVADQGGASLKAMVHGRDTRFGPQPYLQSGDFQSHGTIDGSPDITGGFGFQGLANLESFLDQGGTLVLLGSAGVLATDSGLLRNVSRLGGGAVNTPGSTIQTKVVRADHPLAWGFDEVHHVFRINGPVYSVPQQYEHWIVSQYGVKPPEDDEDQDGDEPQTDEASEDEEDDETATTSDEETGDADSGDRGKKEASGEFLITGYVSGREQLERKGVVLDVPRHQGGRVVLYSFNPLHRYLNHGDHNYVFNAILHWNDFPPPRPKEHPDLATD